MKLEHTNTHHPRRWGCQICDRVIQYANVNVL